MENWSNEKLHRKAGQHWEMAGLAQQDNDMTDALKHIALARKYEQELKAR